MSTEYDWEGPAPEEFRKSLERWRDTRGDQPLWDAEEFTLKPLKVLRWLSGYFQGKKIDIKVVAAERDNA